MVKIGQIIRGTRRRRKGEDEEYARGRGGGVGDGGLYNGGETVRRATTEGRAAHGPSPAGRRQRGGEDGGREQRSLPGLCDDGLTTKMSIAREGDCGLSEKPSFSSRGIIALCGPAWKHRGRQLAGGQRHQRHHPIGDACDLELAQPHFCDIPRV